MTEHRPETSDRRAFADHARELALPLGSLAVAAVLMHRASRGSRLAGMLGTMVGAHAVRSLSPIVSAWLRPNPPDAPAAASDDAPFDDGRDRVDEASWESFPASDPPAYTR